MGNADASVQVTLNGEIYNFKSLRKELIALGHKFRTQSDSEVIVHGYERWGDEVLNRLCGMFGLAIWDERRRRLLLARDRLGMKPVYIAEQPGVFGYASDPRALICMPGVDVDIDEEALALYLSYANVPAPWTIFKGIRKLRPGEMCVVEPDSFHIGRYWNLTFDPQPRSAESCVAQFSALFRNVVDEHLISDVPLGAFLSGGMDSTAVALAASDTANSPLLTFNMAFKDPDANEARWAQEAAVALGTNHQQLDIEDDPEQSVIETLSRFPEPFGDTAAVPNYLLSKAIRERCTVALSGDGGDEVFGGYGLRTAQLLAHLRRLPLRLRKIGASLPGVRKIAASSLNDICTYYAECRTRLTVAQIERMLGSSAQPCEIVGSHIEMMRKTLLDSNARGPINSSLLLDQSFGLPDQMLTKVDVTSMAHSLEVRVPMLDHRVVEFAATLPEEMKQKGFGADRTKKILRYYLKRRFPDSFINRPKKGFGMPISVSMRATIEDKLRCAIGRSDGFLSNHFEPAVIVDLLNSPGLSSNSLWALYSLHVWSGGVSKIKIA